MEPSKLQQAIYDWVDTGTGNAMCKAVAGSGKCLGVDTPVLMYDGRIVPVQNILPGDVLMGPDSKPRTVQAVSSGYGPLYRVVPVKGDPWVCNLEHVFSLKGTNRIGFKG